MGNQDKRRPVANTPEIGTARYLKIKDAIDQYQHAMNEGFFIEAIALMESAISDRLESLLNYNFPESNYSYGTVGNLATTTLHHKDYLNASLIEVLIKLKSWAETRNKAIHEMVKLLPDECSSNFNEQYLLLETCAKDGYELFKELNNEIRKFRKDQDTHELVLHLKDVEHNVINFPEILVIKRKLAYIESFENSKLVKSTTYFEDINGRSWEKQLIDLHYEYVPEREKND